MSLAKEDLGTAGAARYEQIISTAVELFERQGYAGTSLAQIADAVGVRKATLYYYLDSKVQLLQLVYDTVTNQLRDVIQSAVPSQPPCQRLVRIVRNHVDFHVNHQAFVRIVWSERYELPPDVYRTVRAREREYEDFVRTTIEDGITAGCLAGYRADLLTSGLLGLLTTVYRWPRVETSEADFQDAAVGLLLRFVFDDSLACEVHGTLEDAEDAA
jgi:AcrR family transcriptional regulator